MQSTTNFNLSASGQPFLVVNDVENSSSIRVAYALKNLSTAVVTCEGISNATGAVVLDSYSGGTVSNRNISLGGIAFDSLRFTATFSGVQQSAVAVSVSSSGSGATFSAVLNLPNVHTQ